MNATAPIEFTQLGLDRLNFHRSDAKSWRGPCPACGGSRRFVVFTDHEFPYYHGFCDECGRKEKYWEAYQDPVSSEDKRKWAEAAAKAEQERTEYRRRKLAEFTTAEIWAELHERMTDTNYRWWESQGIPADWADFWKLGYTAEKRFEHDGDLFTRSAYTIPKFDLTWKPTNIDYRIIDPPPGVGKYRPSPGLPAAAFLSRPDHDKMTDSITIVEGSKKAMVVSIWQGNENQVIGIPGCSSWAGVDKLQAGRVYIVLDPDARAWALKLARAIGPAARVVVLPVKPDDAFTQHGMSTAEWGRVLRGATI